jgi:predicted RNA-binding protein with PIN domain
MAYLVDGNNVMGQTPGWHRDRASARRKLIRQLADFARASKTRVTVVFDGEPDAAFPDGSSIGVLRIHYARMGSDADTRIDEIVNESTDRRGITVVTSDRELASTVRSSGALVMRSGEFRRRMKEVFNSVKRPEDGEVHEVDDLRSWFRYFGVEQGDENGE